MRTGSATKYPLALEAITGTLAQGTIAVTDQEHVDMLALAAKMKLEGELVPRALAACPQSPPFRSGEGMGSPVSAAATSDEMART